MKFLTSIKNIFFILTVFIIQTMTFGQVGILNSQDNPYFENLTLNTDRELYVAGEKVWFKVNCVETEKNPREIISKIVYLELYDHINKTVVESKYRIINGVATGFLQIPSSLSSGNYYLRAYTQFLRNYSPYLYPGSVISVVNPNKFGVPEKLSSDYDILIVPEGGKLVNGIQSKLAIRISPKMNRKIHESVILDNNKNVLAKFIPSANGLALIDFIPYDSVQYFLKLTLDDSSTVLKPLPSVLRSGLLLSSSYTNSRLKINLISSTSNIKDIKAEYKVEIKSENYKSLFVEKIKLNESVEIRGYMLPRGIVYILLKNKDDEIINVSSKFISEVNSGKIEIKKNKTVFKPGEIVELDMNLSQNNANESSFFITVVKTGTKSGTKDFLPAHIAYNPIFLANYLKTNIVDSELLKKQIDIALILYSPIYNSVNFLENLQQDSVIKWLPEIRDVSISGKLIDKNTRKPLNNIKVYASVFGNNNQIHLYKTKANGGFIFSLNHLNKKQNVFIGTKPIDSIEVKILINNDFSNKYPYSCFIPLDLDTSKLELLRQLYLNAQIDKAFGYHTDKISKNVSYYPLINEKYVVSVALKDFINIPVMSEVFDEIVPFVSTRKKKDQYSLHIFNDKTGETYNDPMVLIDGVPVFEINKLMKIAPELIDRIDVIKEKYYLGNYVLNGIIRIMTKEKNFAKISFPDESVFIEYNAVTTESYPVFPEYKSMIKKDRVPDFRNMLYWNPYLFEKHKSEKIKFYTADNPGDYEITVKGYYKDKQYYGKTYIKVEKKEN